MTRAVEVVLFDFGGVFTDSPFEAVAALGREVGADPSEIVDVVFGPYERDTDHPWHRLERGELALADARAQIVALGKRRGLDVDPFQIFARMGSNGGVREILVDYTRGLRREGYRTALVTNNIREFRETWRRLLPLDELFEVVVDSSEVGVRKPDPVIFRRTLALLGGAPVESAVLLDDHEGNLRAAERIGMRSVLVGPDPREALTELDALLQRDPRGDPSCPAGSGPREG